MWLSSLSDNTQPTGTELGLEPIFIVLHSEDEMLNIITLRQFDKLSTVQLIQQEPATWF